MSKFPPAHARKYLSADSLIDGLRSRFERIADRRRAGSVDHSLPDCLMAAFAMFSLKEPSLLAFDARRQDDSLMNLHRIESIPSDTQHREILDRVDPADLNECFADVFAELQRGGMLKPFKFHDGHYLLAIDGTKYFCSTNISCPQCLVKNSKSGKTEYSHQMVAAVLVHPDQKVVIPIAVEAIVQQDGNNKNDCERNAVRRLLKLVRRLHPKLKCIVIEDGLASNVSKLVVGGRCRLKIENETFNTLKNQGYHLDHNFGHGKKNLSTVFATLMFLAFLVDQVQQLCCPLFAQAMGRFNTRRAYWHHLRCCFEAFSLSSWTGLYKAIIEGNTRNQRIGFNSG